MNVRLHRSIPSPRPDDVHPPSSRDKVELHDAADRAKSVSSLPAPTFSPGLMCVPRWRMRCCASTYSPAYRFTPVAVRLSRVVAAGTPPFCEPSCLSLYFVGFLVAVLPRWSSSRQPSSGRPFGASRLGSFTTSAGSGCASGFWSSGPRLAPDELHHQSRVLLSMPACTVFASWTVTEAPHLRP